MLFFGRQFTIVALPECLHPSKNVLSDEERDGLPLGIFQPNGLIARLPNGLTEFGADGVHGDVLGRDVVRAAAGWEDESS